MSERTGDIPAEEYLCTRIRRAEQALMSHHEAVLRGHGLPIDAPSVPAVRQAAATFPAA